MHKVFVRLERLLLGFPGGIVLHRLDYNQNDSYDNTPKECNSHSQVFVPFWFALELSHQKFLRVHLYVLQTNPNKPWWLFYGNL